MKEKEEDMGQMITKIQELTATMKLHQWGNETYGSKAQRSRIQYSTALNEKIILERKLAEAIDLLEKEKRVEALKEKEANVQLQEKQESIKQEILQLSQAMIKLSDDFRAALIEDELITLSNKSLQITDHFQEFTNMLGLTTPENVVNLLGTENITDVHNNSI